MLAANHGAIEARGDGKEAGSESGHGDPHEGQAPDNGGVPRGATPRYPLEK